MKDSPSAVPKSRAEMAATFSSVLEIHNVYANCFYPAIKSLVSPTPWEQLYVAHGIRGFALLESLSVLNSSRHFQSTAATIRLLFEVAVEVKLMTHAAKILGKPNPESIVVARHELVRKCTVLNRAFRMSKIPELEGTSGKRACENFVHLNRASLDVQARAALGVPAHKCEHWLGMTLKARANQIDKLTTSTRFSVWYENQYSIASLYAHGGIGGVAEATGQEIAGDISLLQTWVVQFVPEHIMRPICVALKLDLAAPDVWIAVREAADRADALRRDFMRRSPEILRNHAAQDAK